MKSTLATAAFAAALGLAALPVLAQPPAAPQPGPQPGLAQLVTKTIPAKSNAALTVTSPAFQNLGDIPFENTQYRTNTFPGLSWTAGPAGTRSYAIVMQDADAMVGGGPILHWTMVNIPASVTSLPTGMSEPPAGASYGPNIRGANQPYMGPRTPPGRKNHYHFQVLALDTTLPPEALANYASLTAALAGHILAAGDLVGLGQADPDAPPAPARGGGAGRGAAAPGRGG